MNKPRMQRLCVVDEVLILVSQALDLGHDLIAYHTDEPDLWSFGCDSCDETLTIREERDRLVDQWGKLSAVKCTQKGKRRVA